MDLACLHAWLPQVWRPASGLAPEVMVVDTLLGELASSAAGEAGFVELSAAAARLVPKLAALVKMEGGCTSMPMCLYINGGG